MNQGLILTVYASNRKRLSLIAASSTDVLGAPRLAGRLEIHIEFQRIGHRRFAAMLREGRTSLMIYEHHAQEGRFFIEWNEPRAWGYSQETKWVGSHKGAVLALGSAPEAVLDAMVDLISRPPEDGSATLTACLPQTLAGWRASHD